MKYLAYFWLVGLCACVGPLRALQSSDSDTAVDVDSDTDTEPDTHAEAEWDCASLPPASGNIIDVTPSQAEQLAEMVASAHVGDTFLLADGTYNVNGDIWIKTDGVTLRSASDDGDAVVLDAGYRGGSVVVVAASDVTLASLTFRNAWYHGVHIRPAGEAHIYRPLLYDIRVQNPGQQGVKVNRKGSWYVDDGVIACSSIALDDEGRSQIRDDCYTGGLDIHLTKNWVIRDNHIEGFWCANGLSEHGIHLWRQNEGAVVERNTIVNCARGIGLGLASKSAGNDRLGSGLDCPAGEYIDDYKSVVRNNLVFANDSRLFGSVAGMDSGISMANACQAQVYHNTVWSTRVPFASIEYRYEGTTGALVNNIASHNLKDRGVTSMTLAGNLQNAEDTLFVNAQNGDLHLNPLATGAVDMGVGFVIDQVRVDIEGDPRDSAPDIGADELN